MLFLGYLAQAWNIMSGYTGQLSFGHAAFFGIGAYTSTLLFIKLGINPWLGMLAGGCLGFLTGIAIGYISFRYRLKGVFFALVTLAFAEVLRLLSLMWVSLTNGASGLLLPLREESLFMFSFGVHKKYIPYYVILGMFLVCTFMAYKIKRVRLGYYLAAMRGNEEAAEMLGINTTRYQSITVGISGFLTAVGGTFYAQYYQHFEPEVVFGAMRSFEFIFPVILGGGGNIMGPIIGASVLQVFEEILRAIIPPFIHGIHRMIYGLLLAGMMMYLPSGIVSLIERGKDQLVSKYKIKSEG
jgi:branched-chain amino acid transport system permease protein